MSAITLVASVAALPSLIAAALLLVARAVAARYELPVPSAEAIVAATGASRSRAYELATQLVALLPTLVRAPGRPPKPTAPTTATAITGAITREVLAYVMRHPGCVDQSVRHRYSNDFRRFIVDLCAEHGDVAIEAMAAAVDVPLGTLKDWAPHAELDARDRGRERA